MRRGIASLALALLLCALPMTSARAHTASIEIRGTHRYKAVRLTPDIYSAANADLSDLLIKNGAGESIPYFIHSDRLPGEAEDADGDNRRTLDFAPLYSVEHDERYTFIHIEGLRHLRLRDITIHTDSTFKRIAQTPDGMRKELFHLELNGASHADTTLALEGHIVLSETYTVSIADNDDKPIAIDGLTVRYFADAVVFEGEADGVYTLEFGDDHDRRAPVYDISRYKDDILAGEIDLSAISAVHYADAQAPPPERNYRQAFNITVAAVAILLCAVILVKLGRRERD